MKTPDQPKKPSEWSPRLWEGCDYFAWLRLLIRNRFAVAPPYWYIAAIVSCVTFANTFFRWMQEGQFGERIRSTKPPTPLFVLGHWRTGTTLLHELLILDERFTSPTTLQCFMPCHFLLSTEFIRKYLAFAMPKKRPMDNMPAGWDRPQEEEFALALLGEPSTYTDVAFPNHPPLSPGSLDLSGLSPPELAKWKRTFYRFVQTIAVQDPRPAVLKSPPHTARVPALLVLFPEAKFVHLVRDPYTLYASTMNLWLSMGKKHGFQTPRGGPSLEEKVFREFRTIHEAYEKAKGLIPPGRLVEVRYEELVRDIVGGMERIYAELNLGGFDAVRPKLEAYVLRSKGYETNKYEMNAETKARVRERWGDIIEELGYAK